MAASLNQTLLAQNDLTAFVMKLDPIRNTTLGVYNRAGSVAGATVRLDASWDGGHEYVTSISLSDPTAAIGAAYLATVAVGKAATTQDRVFGATHVRIVRTDANPGDCFIGVSQSVN